MNNFYKNHRRMVFIFYASKYIINEKRDCFPKWNKQSHEEGGMAVVRGIGIDIIEIERIEKALEKNKKFLYRIFTPKEIAFFSENHFRKNQIAGNFAAKEAVMKALGTGLRGFCWKDIEIDRDALGKPIVVLHNHAEKIAEKKNIESLLVSISHSKQYAVAQAIAI